MLPVVAEQAGAVQLRIMLEPAGLAVSAVGSGATTVMFMDSKFTNGVVGLLSSDLKVTRYGNNCISVQSGVQLNVPVTLLIPETVGKVASGVMAPGVSGPPVALKVTRLNSASVAVTLKFNGVPATTQVSGKVVMVGGVFKQAATSICMSRSTEPA